MKKKRNVIIFLSCLLVAVNVCMLSLAAPVIDYDRKGSIAITMLTMEGIEIPGGTVVLYQVAEVDGTLTDNFKDSGVLLKDTNTENIAMHLSVWASENSITGTRGNIDNNGDVMFENLSLGYYLAVQTEANEGYYVIDPVLFSVPMTNAEGTDWIYDIVAKPKPNQIPEDPDPEYTSRTVKKVWDGNGKHPESVTIYLLQNQEVYDKVILSEENNWTHTWTKLMDSESYEVVETNVPNGYTVSYKIKGTKTTVTNTKKEDSVQSTEPQKPGNITGGGTSVSKLPVTGLLTWPIPVLAFSGIVLFAIGWSCAFKKRKKKNE